MSEPILQIRGLSKTFSVKKKGTWGKTVPLHAVSDVSLALRRGEVLGVVGESGSGKSTLGRLVLRLIEASAGDIRFDGQDVRALDRDGLRHLRRRMQMVFQDPNGSLNPAMTAGQSIMETLRFHNIGTPAGRGDAVLAMMKTVGLDEQHFGRLPHQLSGGQNQRVGMARALVANPDLLVLDEPVSALDVSVQAQVLQLLEQIRKTMSLSMLFISHDLSVVRRVSNRIMVLYLGRVMETASADQLFETPRHPYAKGLLASRPGIDPSRRAAEFKGLSGDLPSPLAAPKGCPFVTRCPVARAKCGEQIPKLEDLGGGHGVACFAVTDG